MKTRGARSLNKRMNSLPSLFSFLSSTTYYFPFHRKIKDLGRCIDGSITFSFPPFFRPLSSTIIVHFDNNYQNGCFPSTNFHFLRVIMKINRIRVEEAADRYRRRSKQVEATHLLPPLRRIDLLYAGSKGRTSRRR